MVKCELLFALESEFDKFYNSVTPSNDGVRIPAFAGMTTLYKYTAGDGNRTVMHSRSGMHANINDVGSMKIMERVMGIEPTSKAWEAFVLPLNYTRAAWRGFSILLLAVSLFFTAVSAPAYSDNWREEARLMLEEGRPEAARALLDDVREAVMPTEDGIKRINTLRYLGELYWQLKDKSLARESFGKAMDYALEVEPIWKKLSVVISVLELQRETEDTQSLSANIQKTLDVRLMESMAGNAKATEIGRYVRTFDAYATASEIAALLQQIRNVEQQPVRSKALYALTEIQFSPDKLSEVDASLLYPPFNAESFEKLMWYTVLARLYHTPQHQEESAIYAAQAKAELVKLPLSDQEKARKVLKRL
jgi:tetratricopeptide (TPR) repeat protein